MNPSHLRQSRMPSFSSGAGLLLPTLLLVIGLCSGSPGCGLDEFQDEITIRTLVPSPEDPTVPHRLTRRVGLGPHTDRVDAAQVTKVVVAVISPDEVDLTLFLGMRIFVNDGTRRHLLAQTTDIQPGQRRRELSLEYTADLRPMVVNSELIIEWEVYYRTTASYPSGGIEVETVIGFNVEVSLFAN